MSSRSRFAVAVHLLFFRQDRILLLRRFNTGWEDGNYSVPAGHVEAGESVIDAAIREAREEVGVHLARQDLRVAHVMHRKAEEERIDFFLVVKRWTGPITNQEPHKCDDLAWFPPSALPANVIPYVRQSLANHRAGLFFSEFGWNPRSGLP
jgi:ADP-ribose pyrophosphatase YjhB (NUDIX family)